MKILVVSNYYPPHHIGGYEIGCRDVVNELGARGHQVRVLTSTYQSGRLEHGNVSRRLELTHDARRTGSGWPLAQALAQVEAVNQKAFSEACKQFQPDLVYFWNLSGLSLSMVFIAAQKKLPIVFYVSDHWFSTWETDAWYEFLAGLSERKPRSRFVWQVIQAWWTLKNIKQPQGVFDTRHVQFCSRYLQDAALLTKKLDAPGRVIHWGVRLSDFPFQPVAGTPKRLLYVGQVVPHKGVHTAIEALRIVRNALPRQDVTLTIAGGTIQGMDSYPMQLRERVRELGLEEAVSFVGAVARETLSAVYHEHDVLIFPSAWQEPFAITPLEAMASGIQIVATTTGGSAEIFLDGQNALTFPAEDAGECARKIIRLLTEPGLPGTISASGLDTVTRRFQFAGMVDQAESDLHEAIGDK